MDITNDIKYIGVDDADLKLFESQYDLPEGMCYNSYVVMELGLVLKLPFLKLTKNQLLG